jgi:DNA mismatch repair protein PMS2
MASYSKEIRLKDFGAEMVEVVDNGTGIAAREYSVVGRYSLRTYILVFLVSAKKHCTSKIQSFEDLAVVQSFGFRGEALNSLCALASQVQIVTATEQEAPKGTKLVFDKVELYVVMNI